MALSRNRFLTSNSIQSSNYANKKETQQKVTIFEAN